MTTTQPTQPTGTPAGPVQLPQLVDRPFIADGGLETSIIFQQGVDLVDFAAFTLLDSDAGRRTLRAYYEPYFELAASIDTGIVIDTPTWRASLDWGARQGFDADAMSDVNRRAVTFVSGIAEAWATVPTVINGAIGPRGDGYTVGNTMSAAEATRYHAMQVEAFAQAGAAMVTAVTMTYADEATGIARAARQACIPVVISFTVETDGCLPSGQTLGDAIEQVDRDTDQTPAYFMVNCAHPSHFDHVLDTDAAWLERIKGVRANASALSHAELDEATELDRGDPVDLATRYVALREMLGGISVFGGCCGTDHEHVAAMAASLS